MPSASCDSRKGSAHSAWSELSGARSGAPHDDQSPIQNSRGDNGQTLLSLLTDEQLHLAAMTDSADRVRRYDESNMSSPRSMPVPLAVDRRVYNQHRFDKEFGYVEQSDRAWSARRYIRNKLACSRARALRMLIGFMPVLEWLPEYKWKRDLAADAIAGITVGIMHIPQGMAYASLAGLDPVYGLYTSFFPTLIYMFFGTSRHVSLGVFAVVSLMVGQVRMRLIPDTPHTTLAPSGITNGSVNLGGSGSTPWFFAADFAVASTTVSTTTESLQSEYTPIEVVTALTLAVAFIQLAMGLLRLGFITAYLSDQVVQGFTTGAAVHVFTAQINKILNVHLPRHSGPGCLIYVYMDLYKSLPDASWASISVSVIAIVFLVIGKEIINPPVKKRIHIPIPFELLVVIFGTLTSYLMNFQDRYDMLVVDYIPNGLPAPRLPPLSVVPKVLGDAVGIAVVAFVVTVSLGKLFAKKHHYRIDPTQELYALGIMNGLCSLVRCYPASTALARSLVYEAAGCRTQFASVFTCSLLFIVLMWMGPLFQALPMCILSSIIVVALKGMFMQLGQLKNLWPVSKIDFCVWMVSFIATVTLDVRDGLIVSVVFALLTTVFRAQRAPTVLLGRIPHTDIYKDMLRYRRVEHVPSARCYRFDAPLMFINTELFRTRCYEECGIDLAAAREVLAKAEDESRERKKSAAANNGDAATEPLNTSVIQSPDARAPTAVVAVQPGKAEPKEDKVAAAAKREALSHLNLPRFIILDCASFNYVDYMGVQVLWQGLGLAPELPTDVYEELVEIGVTVLFVAFKGGSRDMLDRSAFFEHVPKRMIFPTMHDAVTFAQHSVGASDLQSASRAISDRHLDDESTQSLGGSELDVIASY